MTTVTKITRHRTARVLQLAAAISQECGMAGGVEIAEAFLGAKLIATIYGDRFSDMTNDKIAAVVLEQRPQLCPATQRLRVVEKLVAAFAEKEPPEN